MCPISATMQLFVVLVVLLLTCHHVVVKAQQTFQLSLSSSKMTITMDKSQYVSFNVTKTGSINDNFDLYLMISSEDEHIAEPSVKEILIKSQSINSPFDTGNFSIEGKFLGQTTVSATLRSKSASFEPIVQIINTKVIREKRVIDTIFTASVATLVSIIYINFGCALKWSELRSHLKRPFGPIIGFIGQFVVMPLLSYGLGKVLFPDNPEMQLGMFFTGVSPGGGASNVWVAVLDANIDLSITMTAISTFAAFGMMPLWIFTLGRDIFDQGNLEVPYSQISTYAVALVVPLFIGFLIQKYLKKVAAFFVRILKIFSTLLILFIVIFAIVTNLYLFELFSWQIVVAGMGLPWLGYLLAFLLAKVCRQSSVDSLTIAIETGIQNTGIAIFMLRFSLPQPEADLTTIAPVSVAIMTPFPLMFLFLYYKIRTRFWPNQKKSQLLNGNTDSNEIDLDNNTTQKNENKDIATIS